MTQFSKTRLIWAAALTFSVALSIFAVFRGAYIGPDYYAHFGRMTFWPNVFDFGATSPPGYYLIGYSLFKLIGQRNALLITLSILQIILNALAIWWFFIYTERRFRSTLLCTGFALFVIFLPVRMIHAATLGTDWTTIPMFVLALFAFDKFRVETTSTVGNAALLGLILGLANFMKYSFMALLPATLLIFVCIAWTRHWKITRFITISLVALSLPAAIAATSFWASARVHGYNTEKHWLEKGDRPEVTFTDLLTLKKGDVELFEAPEYFTRKIFAPHKYSYLALSHMATFTDSMNLFQDFNEPQEYGKVLLPDVKSRRPWKTPVMRASMAVGILWTLLALVGVAYGVSIAAKNLIRDRLEREDVMAILAIAFFLLMFLPIPFVRGGLAFGYWTPRLILPALLYFFGAAFLFIDRKIAPNRNAVDVAVLVLVLIQCTIETIMLI